MDFISRQSERLQISSPTIPTLDDPSKDARSTFMSRLSVLQNRVRLKKGSSISVPLGVVVLFPVVVIILILVLFLRHPSGPGAMLLQSTQPSTVRRISEKHDKVFVSGCLDPRPQMNNPRANAAFVVLARNKELDGVVQSIRSIERHFNRWFHYPYVFLNDGDFNSTFKETVQNYTSAPVEFGKVNDTLWGFPDWVDPDVAKEGIAKQGDNAIMYGGMESYHHMCRFYSGMFYKHELLQKYDWYWRLEPEITYFCDITYDPFIHMERANKTYGFTIAVKELKETVPNIFRYASAFKRKNNIASRGMWEMFLERPDEELNEEELLHPKKKKNKLMQPQKVIDIDPQAPEPDEIHEDAMDGEQYNMCHFWSNFEIARLDWFRSKEYNEFFEMMDRSGGFWNERWGDAPIHSLAAGVLLSPDDIHYFRDFGYRHTTIGHCPRNAPARQLPRIPYLEKTTLDAKERAKEDEYWEKWDKEQENGVGCRCRCDTDIPEVEGKEGSCLVDWVRVAGGWASP
ncbi:alpha-1,2-mannosyltransferase Kre5 [Rhizodiscina lignyota]|uniref:Alpha-1,2-mannosyltransferase Kre5 n=1 Tax=Rhizodiscina lignyota TaxID=1504668 RepID=A0A9P4IP83_9PEZI|nr:alpha-1,2-mannosyltransferase Kre5 [Rhizodiscina lignyota]